MYKYLAKFVKILTKLFRFIQICFVVYFIMFLPYWGAQVVNSNFAYKFNWLFNIPTKITESLLLSFNWVPSKEFEVLHPLTFYSILLLFLFLIIFNFIFFPLDNIEKFFVEKSYDKGEHKY